MEQERNDLDARLEAQESLRSLVNELPSDELSMAWRADLNEKLRAIAPSPKSRVWGWLWKPAAGLGLASILVVAVLVKAPQANAPTNSNSAAIASAMLQAHDQAVAHQELGTVSAEALSSDSAAVPSDWNEIDLTTL